MNWKQNRHIQESKLTSPRVSNRPPPGPKLQVESMDEKESCFVLPHVQSTHLKLTDFPNVTLTEAHQSGNYLTEIHAYFDTDLNTTTLYNCLIDFTKATLSFTNRIITYLLLVASGERIPTLPITCGKSHLEMFGIQVGSGKIRPK